MPSRKRGRKARKHPRSPQPSSSKTPILKDSNSADAIRSSSPHMAVPGAHSVTELGQLDSTQARSNATQAQVVVSDLGRKGHNYNNNIITENARAHFGNVYNFNQPSYSVLDDSRAPDLIEALSFDGMCDRLMSITPAYAETCSWILDRPEYLRWQDPEQRVSHHGILWIKGKAGTGKSTLMSYLLEHDCQHDRNGISVSFFFNARVPDRLVKSTEGMYRCLLHQILRQLPRLKESLTHLQVPRSKQEAWPIERLESAFRIVVLGLSAGEKMTCFVDALDECKINDVKRAIERFEDLSESATTKNIQFRICFSSRYYPQITMRHHEELRLDLQLEHMQDISQYIDNKLTVPERAKLELSPKIYDRCSGIFLWVVLVVKQLREKSDTGNTRSQLLAILDEIPEELEDLFAKVVSEPDNALISIVQWTLFSNMRLEIEELYFAVQTSIGGTTTSRWDANEIDSDSMVRFLLHASRGLMESTYSHDLFHKRRDINFIHESVRGYFLSGGLASMDRTSTHEPYAVGHAKIAEGCLRYLKHAVDQSSISELWEPESRTKSGLPLLRYAWQNVLRHTEVAFAGDAVDLDFFERFPPHHVIFLSELSDSQHSLSGGHNNPSALLYLLLQQGCPQLARALLARTLKPSHSSIPAQHTKTATSYKNTRLATPDLKSKSGSWYICPLHLAISRGYKDLVQLLLDYGAYVDKLYGSGTRPIDVAVSTGHCDIVHILFRHGARIAAKDILHTAVGHGRKDIVRCLLANGIDVNGLDDSSQTALHLTLKSRPQAREDDAAIAEVLLEAGADTEAADNEGNTVLIKAAGGWRTLIVQALLKKGANVHARNRHHLTALHAAVNDSGRSSLLDIRLYPLLQALLNSGADINADGGSHGTVLTAAYTNGNLKLVKFLVDHGAIVTDRDRQYDDLVAEVLLKASQDNGEIICDSRPESPVSDTWSTGVQFSNGED